MGTMAASSSDLYLDGASPKAKVLPVVHFGILDHYSRRSEVQQRVIGTLLGVHNGDGSVNITNCFPVPHNESDTQVAVDMEYHRTMFDLHRQVNPKEVIVGWYATGREITEHSVLIHEFYSRETDTPIHLCVDTQLHGERMAVAAYVSAPMGVPDPECTVGTLFTPVPCESSFYDTEEVGLQALRRTLPSPDNTTSLTSDIEHVANSIESLQEKLGLAVAYVERVMNGEIAGDPKIGRYLLDTISAVPKLDPEQFEKMFNNSLQDLLMVVYLANLTRTQVTLQEKLNAVL